MRVLANFVVLVFAAAAIGQTVYSERLVAAGGNGVSHKEVVIEANPLNPADATVVWQAHRITPSNAIINYSLTLDGYTYRSPHALVPQPLPGEHLSFDPIIAVSEATGDVWLGGLEQTSPAFGRLIAAPKRSGANDISHNQLQFGPHDSLKDKPWLAIGPKRPNTPGEDSERMYFTALANGVNGELRYQRVTELAGVLNWDLLTPILAPDPLSGPATSSVVIQAGPQKGRLIVSKSDKYEQPRWTRSDDEGGTWSDAATFTAYFGGGGIRDLYLLSGPAFVPPHMRAITFTDMAIDPNDPNRVYILFSARESGSANAQNVDLFIAYSTDAGDTFPVDQTFRLTDAQLRMAGEPAVEADQLMPAIAVDGYGGINISFVHTTSADNPPSPTTTYARIRYARFANAAQLAGGTPFLSDLCGDFAVDGTNFTVGVNLNDYMGITASQCYVYAAYARTSVAGEPSSPYGSIYVRRILVSDGCLVDADSDGAVTLNDPVAFNTAFAEGSPSADANSDGTLNTQDVAAFMDAYANLAP